MTMAMATETHTPSSGRIEETLSFVASHNLTSTIENHNKMSGKRRQSAAPSKDQTCLRIERMEAEREERRRAMVERKKARAIQEQRNIAAGNPGDVDFIGMVQAWRTTHARDAKPFRSDEPQRICICVRKRPISDKEREKNDHDSVTCLNPAVWIHSAKLRVDGITKYLDHNSFTFDHSFDETKSTEDVYKYTTMPLLDFCVSGQGGRATVFAFGQTGSGKTYTMQGIQEILAHDLYLLLSQSTSGCTDNDTCVMVSYFEMYGGMIQDLLNERARLKVLEDGQGEIVVNGLTESQAATPEDLLELLHAGNLERTTHITQANDSSSRSHAICQIMLRDRENGKLRGKLSLVDLAGSERGADTTTHNAQRRGESAEINTSLLALKECIRALDATKKERHVPYRSSKLTLILKDCFTSASAMTTMITTVSPGASSADHSLNTLRYADRTKEKGPKKSPRFAQTRSPIRLTQLSPQRKQAQSRPAASSPRPVSSPKPRQTGTVARVDQTLKSNAMGTVALSCSQSNAQKKEETFQRKASALLEQEERLLHTHMNNIQTNAELLQREGSLLSQIQEQGDAGEISVSLMDNYATVLEDILDQKEDMIFALRQQMDAVRVQGTSR